MEVASRGTWRDDEKRKAKLYEQLGVKEYWQYDPTGDYLGLHLKGRRLVGDKYEPQPVVDSLDGTVFLRSETLGLDFRVKGEERYFFDPAAGRRLLTLSEQVAAQHEAELQVEWEAAARRDAETQAAAAQSRADAAEARAAELEALLREARGSQGGR